MPLLVHSVTRPFTMHRQPVQLPRQANSEIADVNHLLDLAVSFLETFAHFIRDQPAQGLLFPPQPLADLPHNLATTRRGPGTPDLECLLRRRHHPVIGSLVGLRYDADPL